MGTRDSGALRVHDFVARSRANGPGIRAVLWLQGCSLGCACCFNPETHSREAGIWVTIAELFARLAELSAGIEGLTVSGGEPLEQAKPLRALLERLRFETSLSAIVISGFTLQEVTGSAEKAAILPFVDVLVAGRYDSTQRLAHGLRGSANKTTHFLSERYTEADLEAVPPAEITIDAGGEVVISGIDPPDIHLLVTNPGPRETKD